MSRFNGQTRPIIASKTTYDVLIVDSGEESDDDHLSDVEREPVDSLPLEAAKPSKSAIKKANRLARLERKQQQKLKSKGKETTDDDPASPSLASQPDSILVEQIATEPSKAGGIAVVDPVPVSPSSFSQFGAVAEEPQPHIDAAVLLPEPVLTHTILSQQKVPVETLVPLPQLQSEMTVNASSPTNGSPAQTTKKSSASTQDAEKVKKRQNALTRILWTFIMIFGFIGLLLLGHAYLVLLVLLCQTLVYREVTALFSLKSATPESRDYEDAKGKDPWSKTLNWYFFAVTNYFLYGESIIYYFKHVVFADAQLLPFATNHRMISFTLYTIGFMGFVMSLKKGYLKQQFGLFCWVHMSLLLIVLSSHFIVNNILEGLIWFWVPASLVICNDCFAYIWGVTVGRTPLIKLSPKKTVEGFVGAFICTVIFAVFWGTEFMRFDYMICPVHDLGVSAWSSSPCTPNPVFVWRSLKLWKPFSLLLTVLSGHSVTTLSYAPYQLHLLVLACFASLVAPFGGFFASGFKRAVNIKDFGHSIPGHGGMTDRMDCQFLMGVFTYVYYSSLVRLHQVTVGGLLQTIVSGLAIEQQLELIHDLTRYLEKQGISVP